jgi:alkanesulfonate monooxygenase SsuD/methylene tetrahydromethanopterin reductase-like flavin-dependent oxidoreductase (luciferase family)
MKVGLQIIFQNHGNVVSDRQMVAEELRIAELAEPLGFDEIWPVEHHFTDYSSCPDNVQLLSYLAGKTRTIKLATGAVILPWNDPLRVAEKMLLLDHLSDGRAIFGMGRGLARREYAGFGIAMEESRERFDEAAAMILDALETGVMAEHDGRYYRQARTEIRPGPIGSFKDRLYAVAMSPDSVLQAAALGANMVLFSSRPDEMVKASLDAYAEEFRTHHHRTPPPARFCDFMICDESAERARELAYQHIAGYFVSVMNHYELTGQHFKESKAYSSYGEAVDMMRALGLEDMSTAYVDCQSWGTPQQILDRLERRRGVVGDFELSVCVKFSGMAYDVAERSMRLFASTVLPELHAARPRVAAAS